MCIILGAIFEISFEVSINTAKDIVENPDITLAVHSSQMGVGGLLDTNTTVDTSGQLKEFVALNDTCSWTSTNYDKCTNDDDLCCWIKKLAEDAYTGQDRTGVPDIAGETYEETIKVLLRNGKYAIMKSYLTQQELIWGDQYNQGMGWHRSEDSIVGIYPSRGYLANKKWIFNEDITIFIFFHLNIFNLHP